MDIVRAAATASLDAGHGGAPARRSARRRRKRRDSRLRRLARAIRACRAPVTPTTAPRTSAAIGVTPLGMSRNEMNAVWETWVDPAQPPARATVESRLAADDILVEVQVQALV